MITRFVRAAILCTAAIVMSGCAAPGASPEAIARLAPGGKLRVGLVMDARELVVPDAGSGEVRGPAMDLGRSMAARLGVAFEPVRFQNFAALRALATEGIQKGHMARHARTVATAAGVPVDAVEEIARALVAAGDV